MVRDPFSTGGTRIKRPMMEGEGGPDVEAGIGAPEVVEDGLVEVDAVEDGVEADLVAEGEAAPLVAQGLPTPCLQLSTTAGPGKGGRPGSGSGDG